jgi:hypothetical protein
MFRRDCHPCQKTWASAQFYKMYLPECKTFSIDTEMYYPSYLCHSCDMMCNQQYTYPLQLLSTFVYTELPKEPMTIDQCAVVHKHGRCKARTAFHRHWVRSTLESGVLNLEWDNSVTPFEPVAIAWWCHFYQEHSMYWSHGASTVLHVWWSSIFSCMWRGKRVVEGDFSPCNIKTWVHTWVFMRRSECVLLVQSTTPQRFWLLA